MERATLGVDIDGAYLRKLRTRQGKSVTRLAKEAGISHQFLSFIERGARRPMPEVFARICTALGIEDSIERSTLVQAGRDAA